MKKINNEIIILREYHFVPKSISYHDKEKRVLKNILNTYSIIQTLIFVYVIAFMIF